jgi:hypothetical protein
MRDLSEKRNRYLRDALPVRLGNLASNLAHVSTFAKGAANPTAVERLLDESRFFIEWTAAETVVDTAAELVELQIQLSWWYHNLQAVWSNPAQLANITQQTRAWSDRVIDLSGLLQEQGN